PYAGFDVAGAGNVTSGAGLRPRAKALDEPPDPTVGAPVLDPTCEGVGVKLPRATRLCDSFDQSLYHNSCLPYPKVGCAKAFVFS
ncbi:MAG: hypothetical protein ABSG35_24650, partial [Syntrophobacteraceae bacterium]